MCCCRVWHLTLQPQASTEKREGRLRVASSLPGREPVGAHLSNSPRQQAGTPFLSMCLERQAAGWTAQPPNTYPGFATWPLSSPFYRHPFLPASLASGDSNLDMIVLPMVQTRRPFL